MIEAAAVVRAVVVYTTVRTTCPASGLNIVYSTRGSISNAIYTTFFPSITTIELNLN